MTKPKVISQLNDVLEQERNALFQGELDKLVGLIEKKRALIEALNAFGVTKTYELDMLKGKAARNQELLNSALKGIKSVSTRLAALQKVRKCLDTYDAKGRKMTIQTQLPRKLEKRA